jgi:hypothetical protein
MHAIAPTAFGGIQRGIGQCGQLLHSRIMLRYHAGGTDAGCDVPERTTIILQRSGGQGLQDLFADLNRAIKVGPGRMTANSSPP